jgi:RHS repeat-associated protein
MVRVEDSVVMNFKVDGLGFRRFKEVVGQYQRWFVYDMGASEVPGLAPLVAEYDGNGNLVAKYHYDGGGLLAMTRNNESYWYGFEGIGTTRQLMGSQGQVVDAYAFDAWGNEITNPQSQVQNPFKYVGKHGYYSDTESALMLLGVRYYSAANGLFLSRDLIEGYGYSYAADNPARWMDPQGLQFEEPNNQTCSIVNGQRECAPSRGGRKPKPKPKWPPDPPKCKKGKPVWITCYSGTAKKNTAVYCKPDDKCYDEKKKCLRPCKEVCGEGRLGTPMFDRGTVICIYNPDGTPSDYGTRTINDCGCGPRKDKKPNPDNWIDISHPNCKTGWMCVEKGPCLPKEPKK